MTGTCWRGKYPFFFPYILFFFFLSFVKFIPSVSRVVVFPVTSHISLLFSLLIFLSRFSTFFLRRLSHFLSGIFQVNGGICNLSFPFSFFYIFFLSISHQIIYPCSFLSLRFPFHSSFAYFHSLPFLSLSFSSLLPSPSLSPPSISLSLPSSLFIRPPRQLTLGYRLAESQFCVGNSSSDTDTLV